MIYCTVHAATFRIIAVVGFIIVDMMFSTRRAKILLGVC